MALLDGIVWIVGLAFFEKHNEPIQTCFLRMYSGMFSLSR